MLTKEAVDRTVARISLMPFFPGSDEAARGVITEEIVKMATSDDQVTWLGYRMIQLYPKQWPGISELRAVFCKRFKPADGVQVDSAVYDEYPTEAQLGVIPELCLPPSPTEREAIEAAKYPAPAGLLSASPELETLIVELAADKTIPPIIQRRSIQEIEQDLYARRSVASTEPTPKPTAPGSESAPSTSNVRRITQADIDEALRKRNEARS